MTYEPLLITADVPHGISHSTPWGIALDGLLASELWAQHLAELADQGSPPPDVRNDACPPDLDLPLQRCRIPSDPNDWHWACTCSQPVASAGDDLEVRYWTSRADHRALEQLATKLPATVSDRQGRYRARRMPLLVTSCTAVQWLAVGNATEIRRLLKPIGSIGKKRSHGEGVVTTWTVTSLDVDAHHAAHLHLDGQLGRPCPAECAPEPLKTTPRATAGLRPPYMHPSRRRELLLPSETST